MPRERRPAVQLCWPRSVFSRRGTSAWLTNNSAVCDLVQHLVNWLQLLQKEEAGERALSRGWLPLAKARTE